MFELRLLGYIKQSVSACLLSTLLLQIVGVLLVQMVILLPQRVDAAEVTIDTTASTIGGSYNTTGTQTVFIDDAVGYTFYRDSTGQCVYSKTSNAGGSWGTPILFDSQTDCLKVVVWYDRWTPGDSGDFIHIGTLDSSDDAVFYNRLDTSTDTLLNGSSPTNTAINSGQAATISVNVNSHTLAKATDGTIYVALNDGSDSYALSCSVSCGSQTSWTEVGTSPFDLQNDYNILMPLAGGNMMVINRDISANDMRSAVWNGTAWSAWSTIDANAVESATYDGGFSATLDIDSGNIFLLYVADNDSAVADHDIRSSVYDGAGWTNTADILTDVAGRGIHHVAAGYDQNKGEIYAVYSIESTIGTPASANIYWKVSGNAMTSWGAETGPLNTTSDDIYSPFVNLNSYERIYGTWWDASTADMLGNTIANIGPDTLLTTLGTATNAVRSPSTNFYAGATFVLSSLSNRSVSSFRLSESGSINASTELSNIKLFYELDTSDPYDCASEFYSGAEAQFGATDTNGFSTPDGGSTFAGTVVNISPTATVCFYPVFDVLDSADSGDTIQLQVTDPSTEISVSDTVVFPAGVVALSGATSVLSPNLTQNHFHWRNDDGSETGATSATAGIQDTALPAVTKGVTRRLRLEVSNEGATTSLGTVFQLEYGVAAPTCTDTTLWTDVAAGGDEWRMEDSLNLVNGSDTTNISAGNGGVTDEATTFLTPNGGVRDTESKTGAVNVGTNEFIELEYSIAAEATAVDGETYCFRVTNQGQEISFYEIYPSVTIAADATVSAIGTQISSVNIPSTNVYFGGAFAVSENVSSRTITDITLTETGTVDASAGLANIRLLYDVDATAPYNCQSESYSGAESQFGVTDVDGFSSTNGTSTFSDSVAISTSASLCLYVVSDVTTAAVNAESVQLEITSPSTDVVANAGTVAPATPVALTGETTLAGGVLTQTHYQWRNDDGNEAGATSASGGLEDTAIADFDLSSEIRLRFGVSNEGSTASVPTRFRLEFAPKITTCANVSVWTDVDAVPVDDWDMSDSVNLTNGADTTNIAVVNGGVTDENTTFLTPNGGVRDTESITGSTTLATTEHTDIEYSITSTATTLNDLTYCFRLSAEGAPLQVYSVYPELSTVIKRDFRTQRGNAVISGTSTVLVAGVDYTPPASANTAFIRITNSNHTGAGGTAGGGAQNADDVTAYITNPGNILTSVTLARPQTAINDTFVDWEIIEFVGLSGTDNEIVVRDVGTVNFSNAQLTRTGASTAVTDDSSVVVFVTGSRNQNTSRNFYASQVTSEWSAGTDEPVFTRGATGNAFADVSYAVVEFTGLNWNVQRVEHRHDSAAASTTPITAVSSLEQTFLHTQKRMGASINVVHFGHTAWLSSVGAVSFALSGGADTAIEQTSVAWVIENTQTGANAMKVQRQNGSTINGVEPLTIQLTISTALNAVNNASLFVNSQAAGTNSAYPRPIMGARLTSPTTYEIWRSDTGTQLDYRTEIVEWPVADLTLRQNYYRSYDDNDALTPTDPWPPGPTDLGENTSITAADSPMGENDYLRIRMSVRVGNANMPAGLERFKLQFSERVSTCTAVGSWTDVGQVASSTVWTGYYGTSTIDGTSLSSDPPTPGDLLISVSDVAGTLEHENDSASNPYVAYDGEDVEYDWFVKQNGAVPGTSYCFRMVRESGAELDGYLHYPQIRSADFSPVTQNWRWYSDPENETPTVSLAAENTIPANVENLETLALRITVREQSNVNGFNTKFKLQFSESNSFTNATQLVATSSCMESSLWCYVEGAVDDNTPITTALLSDSDGCASGAGSGCGTHNSAAEYVIGHAHGALQSKEYSFTLKPSGARVNAVYYFRLVDASSDTPVPLAASEQYPAIVSGYSSLTFAVAGLPAGTTTAGVVTGATTTAAAVNFGKLAFDTDTIAAQRITVDTNATEGYQVLKYASQNLLNNSGAEIPSITPTNAAPAGWATSCAALGSTGCVGYHTTDAVLSGGSTRFAATDTYAALSTNPVEIMYASIPKSDTADVIYRVQVNELQPAGDYVTDIVYLAVPVF